MFRSNRCSPRNTTIGVFYNICSTIKKEEIFMGKDNGQIQLSSIYTIGHLAEM